MTVCSLPACDTNILGMTARRTEGEEWEWPPVANTLETPGIYPIKEYIQRRQVKISEQVACCPIYEMCTGAERMTASSRFMRRWDQDVGREVECPGDDCSFKNNYVGSAP